jgi:PIN domain nuclease of toxin-antitoxin system
MLIAQAQVEHLTRAIRDSEIPKYGVDVLPA